MDIFKYSIVEYITYTAYHQPIFLLLQGYTLYAQHNGVGYKLLDAYVILKMIR